MATHDLKTDPEVFKALWRGSKTFEIRFDDRGYAVDDILHLRETMHSGQEMKEGAPLVYTGRQITLAVRYVLSGPLYGLQDGWVIMSGILMSPIIRE